MNNFLRGSNKGFTIIELLAVFAVIGLLSTISVAAFIDYSRNQTFSQAVSDFSNTVSSAKSGASSQVITINYKDLSGNPLSVSCVSPGVLNGYIVDIDLSLAKYRTGLLCTTGVVFADYKSLPKDVTFSSSSTVNKIYFQVITGAVTGTMNGSGVNGDKKVVLTSFGKNTAVTVNSIGVIKVIAQ